MGKRSKGFLATGLGASCCVLPLVLIAVGLGGSLLTVALVRYKLYLMAAALLALAFAWLHYVRDARQYAAQLCEVAGGRLRRWLLGLNTAVVALFFLVNYSPVGAFLAVDFTGRSTVATEANIQRASVGKSSVSIGGKSSSATDDVPAGATRMERLALRVEGMT